MSIYDTPKAYSEWSEALKQPSLCISVEESTIATPKKNTEKKENTPRNPSSVLIYSLILNRQKTTLIKHGNSQLTEDEFELFLIIRIESQLKRRIQWKQ
jgi:hypothetical protein